MNDQIAIKVENLTKIYKLYEDPIDRMKESLHWRGKKYHKDFYALNDLNFEIKKGETVGIIGKNGSGKSTLLKIITGVLSPTAGKVIVNGRVSALLELGAGFNPEYTGIENIYFQGNLMGYEQEEIDSKLKEILEFADIGDFINQPVKMYSSGMFARLAFAVAINVEPDILIVDEALSVGDAKFQNKCLTKIKTLQDSGVTVLFVSHSTSQINSICSSAIWVSSGNLVAEGSAQDVTSLYIFDQNKHERESVQNVENKSQQFFEDNIEYRTSIIEVMKNSKDLQFIGYKILNEFGKDISTINKPGVYELEIKYFINNDIVCPFAVFMLENVIGESIIKFNSIQLDNKLDSLCAGKYAIIRTRFDIPDLATGDYFIKFSIHNGEILNNQAILNLKILHFEYKRTIKQDGYLSVEAFIYQE